MKSPIVMKAFTNKWKPCIAQTVFMNTANRDKNDPIARHYELQFNTEVEALSFSCTVNIMYDKKEQQKQEQKCSKLHDDESDGKSADSDDDGSVYPDVYPPDEYFKHTQDPFPGYLSD